VSAHSSRHTGNSRRAAVQQHSDTDWGWGIGVGLCTLIKLMGLRLGDGTFHFTCCCCCCCCCFLRFLALLFSASPPPLLSLYLSFALSLSEAFRVALGNTGRWSCYPLDRDRRPKRKDHLQGWTQQSVGRAGPHGGVSHRDADTRVTAVSQPEN
jgi:hypothetical protein